MAYPRQLRMVSVLPTWVELQIVICSTIGSENEFMIPARYGVRSVLHLPLSADVRFDNRRCLSLHSETVRSSGGAQAMRSRSVHWTVMLAVTLPEFPFFWRVSRIPECCPNSHSKQGYRNPCNWWTNGSGCGIFIGVGHGVQQNWRKQ